MIQVLTEAGWSSVAFDYAKRNEDYSALVLIYFVILHMIIVLILATSIKGIFWEVYFSVKSLEEQRDKYEKI
jgi:hypothetical protein